MAAVEIGTSVLNGIEAICLGISWGDLRGRVVWSANQPSFAGHCRFRYADGDWCGRPRPCPHHDRAR